MSTASWLAVAAVGLFLALHLASEIRGATIPRALGKVAASVAFVLLALSRGIDGTFDRLVLAGLLLSVAGDVLLLSARRTAFLAGLAAFLLAHVAYAAAFAPLARRSGWTALAIAAAGALVLRWLWPHLASMRAPVVVYCLVISAMLWLALGVGRAEVRLGAALFYASDLLVARDRFVAPGPVNRLVGLPLYYAAQVLLALAIGPGNPR